MNGRYDAWMNGVSFSTIDESLLLTGLAESEPTMAISTVDKLGGGTARLNAVRRSLSVRLGFNILDNSADRRKEICRRVYKWAKSGYLEVSDRPGQRLRVVCDAPPALDTSSGATDQFTVNVTAYENPWWESCTLSTATMPATETEASISVLGDCETLLSATITGQAAVTTVTITTELSTVGLTGLTVAAGVPIEIDYLQDGILTVKAGDDSLYSKLNVASDDVLRVPAGASTVTITSNTSVSATLKARGRFE